ncbi:hypothetical protein FGB62_189g023 [Gracilaria domingensis]|nr:hypothetical protein FGB62_189g023 [Gracilaria domingensis]
MHIHVKLQALLGLFHLFLGRGLGHNVVVVNGLEGDGAVERGRRQVAQQDVEAVDILQRGEDARQRAQKDAPAGEDAERARGLVDVVGVDLRRAAQHDDHDVAQRHELQHGERKVRAAHERERGGVRGHDEQPLGRRARVEEEEVQNDVVLEDEHEEVAVGGERVALAEVRGQVVRVAKRLHQEGGHGEAGDGALGHDGGDLRQLDEPREQHDGGAQRQRQRRAQARRVGQQRRRQRRRRRRPRARPAARGRARRRRTAAPTRPWRAGKFCGDAEGHPRDVVRRGDRVSLA